MTGKVIIIYDDTHKPDREIASITGGKSFGGTIFRRVTLRERTKEFFETLPCVEAFYDIADILKGNICADRPVILFFSSFAIADKEAMATIAEKALYAHENYKITAQNKIACVIFPSPGEFASASSGDFESYAEIPTENTFIDLSEVANFRQFITSGFEARFFNSVSGDEYTLVKRSENIDKLRKEYTFYGLLPESMKQWFVRPFGYRESEGTAEYRMQRFHMTDLAIRYIHGSIGIEEFEAILDKLFYFIANRCVRKCSSDEYEKMAQELYINKLESRIADLKSRDEYGEIADLITASTAYKSIDEIVDEYKNLFNDIRSEKKFLAVSAVGHGDLCFSNILYSHEASLLMLIDPKGALSENELYMDPYYDIAKLSHSICGHYDYFNSDLFEIVIDEKLEANLKVDADNRAYVELFKKKLAEHEIDFRIVRLYEASLFLSMLPLHIDRPRKVFAFVLNAIAIMKSLKEPR